jgi:hypothetical protein
MKLVYQFSICKYNFSDHNDRTIDIIILVILIILIPLFLGDHVVLVT